MRSSAAGRQRLGFKNIDAYLKAAIGKTEKEAKEWFKTDPETKPGNPIGSNQHKKQQEGWRPPLVVVRISRCGSTWHTATPGVKVRPSGPAAGLTISPLLLHLVRAMQISDFLIGSLQP